MGGKFLFKRSFTKYCKWKGETLTQGIEGDILMIADLYGDWREEIITALPGEYVSTQPIFRQKTVAPH